MRTIRLGREFDAVFVHDAIDYMTDEAELRHGHGDRVRPLPPWRHRPVHAGRHPWRPSRKGPTTEATMPPMEVVFDTSNGTGTRIPTTRRGSTEYAFLLREVDGSIRGRARDPPHGTLWPGRLDAAAGRSWIRPGGRHRRDTGGAPAPGVLHRAAKRGSGQLFQRPAFLNRGCLVPIKPDASRIRCLDRKGAASMTWFVASWASAAALVCRWIWAATKNGSRLDEAQTLHRLQNINKLRVPTS